MGSQPPYRTPCAASAVNASCGYRTPYTSESSRNAFAGYSYDGFLILDAAVPLAAKKAKPGTPEFRAALRDAIESAKNVVGSHGVYSMSPKDHTGLDNRARVLVQVQGGSWRLMK